jgi:hypothetical protein
VEPAESTTLADRTVDLIAVAQAAHWFELPRFYMEARRVGRPKAAIALIGYGRTGLDGAAGEVVDDFYSRVLGKWWPPERAHIETAYRHVDFPFAEEPAPSIEMSVSWTCDQLIGYISTWSAVRAMEKAEGSGEMREFEVRLRAAWGAADVRRVNWPLQMRIGRIG